MFDLGGGTLDVSMLDCSAEVFEVGAGAGAPFRVLIRFLRSASDQRDPAVTGRDDIIVRT